MNGLMTDRMKNVWRNEYILLWMDGWM